MLQTKGIFEIAVPVLLTHRHNQPAPDIFERAFVALGNEVVTQSESKTATSVNIVPYTRPAQERIVNQPECNLHSCTNASRPGAFSNKINQKENLVVLKVIKGVVCAANQLVDQGEI